MQKKLQKMVSKFQFILTRPMSTLAILSGLFIIIYAIVQIFSGNLYVDALNDMDATTLVALGILIMLGVFSLRDQTDLHAVSFTLVNALSFIFIYEAIYKWSFYLAPFIKPMPPAEIREFIIQAGIALTVLTGFAVRDFTLKKWTFIWLGIFVALWIFWLLVGFPQITNKFIFPQVIPVNFTHDMTYVLNRSTKAVMCLAYLTLFPPLRKPDDHSTA
jgi:hypothetical protein